MEQIGINSRKTYSEIYEILNILGKEAIDKLPHKLYVFIEKNMDKEYKPNLLNEEGLIDETKISQETIALFAILNMKYFMQDEEEKKKLMQIYRKNEEKYQAELREKYNPDIIFKDKNINITQNIQEESNEEHSKNLPIEIKKQNIFKRLLSFIKTFVKM